MISVIAPVYNEADNLAQLHTELTAVMAGLGQPYEIIFVDDGSTDGSTAVMRQLAKSDSHVRVVVLRRNYGQTAALSAGVDRAQGDLIITIDADNQNDPADIPMLLAKMREGYDVVSGWRHNRCDAALSRKLPSRVANWIIGYVTGVRLHDYGCSLKVYDAQILREVRLYGELHRFIPALCAWRGARVAEVKVHHRPRTKGVSKYGIGRTTRVILDLLLVKFLTSYVTRPIHFFGTFGLISVVVGVMVCAFLAVERVFFQQPLKERPLILLGVLLIIIGVQFVATGIMCEMISRIYFESRGVVPYSVRKEDETVFEKERE